MHNLLASESLVNPMGACASRGAAASKERTTHAAGSSTSETSPSEASPDSREVTPTSREVTRRESRFSLSKSETTEKWLAKQDEKPAGTLTRQATQQALGGVSTAAVGFDTASREFTKDRPGRRSRRSLMDDMNVEA